MHEEEVGGKRKVEMKRQRGQEKRRESKGEKAVLGEIGRRMKRD